MHTFPEVWDAPGARGPLDAVVTIPGSKSLTNRALLIAALAHEPTVLHNVLVSRDTELMIDALRAFSVDIQRTGTTIRVTVPSRYRMTSTCIDCGLAGTVMRFIPALALYADKPIDFVGDSQAQHRPMKPLLDALQVLGARVTYHGKEGFLPFTLTPASGNSPVLTSSTRPVTVTIDAHDTSQFVSALLLATARSATPINVVLAGSSPSISHIRMTVDQLRMRGATIYEHTVSSSVNSEDIPASWTIEPSHLRGGTWSIEPDLTNAGPFLAAPLICGGQVCIENWPTSTTQVGDMWRKLIPMMGGRIGRQARDAHSSYLMSRGTGTVGGIDINLYDGGELAPLVAGLATVAVSPSTISGIGHLVGHETNRLEALTHEITALGVRAHATSHTLRIYPGAPQATCINTYNDHRMVMFGALVGLTVKGIRVDNPQCVSKTFPSFIEEWEKMMATSSSSCSV